MLNVRQPTIREGADALLRCMTKDEPRKQLAYLRSKFGDDFANKVSTLARSEWKKK